MPLVLMVNGQERSFPELVDGCSLSALVGVLDLKSDRVAVELNGEIVARSHWDACTLKAPDRLEIVHFVGGGCCQKRPLL